MKYAHSCFASDFSEDNLKSTFPVNITTSEGVEVSSDLPSVGMSDVNGMHGVTET